MLNFSCDPERFRTEKLSHKWLLMLIPQPNQLILLSRNSGPVY